MDLLSETFPGETPDGGGAMLVTCLRTAANVRVHGTKPKTVYVDRGRGFYHTATGGITPEFAQVLGEQDFRPFMAADAARQPGFLADVLLHETAVSWVRDLETKTTPASPWLESRHTFGERMREIARRVNQKHNVDGLCRELPARVQALVDKEGDRLPK